MSSQICVSDVRFVPGSPALSQTGLEGWVSFTLNDGLRVDGVVLRRGRDGRRFLSFPTRWDRGGREHPYLRPLGPGERADLERQVFLQLRAETADFRTHGTSAERRGAS